MLWNGSYISLQFRVFISNLDPSHLIKATHKQYEIDEDWMPEKGRVPIDSEVSLQAIFPPCKVTHIPAFSSFDSLAGHCLTFLII
jgi:hypothetical protein